MNRISSDNQLGPEQPGTVISHYSTEVAVEDLHGQVFRCFFRQNCDQLVVGDHVMWQIDKGNRGVVTGVAQRKNVLSRHGKDSREQIMAANVDSLVIMFSAEETVSMLGIDRYIVAAELSKIKATLVVNKIELLTDEQREQLEDRFKIYKDLGYSVHFVSVDKKIGIRALRQELADKCNIIVGQSGVGKSSLINLLLPHESVRVGEVSEVTRKGKHTTTGAHLYHIPSGGDLIDSAGIRHFNCWHTTADEVERGFIEFAPYFGLCKFRNCEHAKEPHCALQDAVKAGNISAERLGNYHKMVAELT